MSGFVSLKVAAESGALGKSVTKATSFNIDPAVIKVVPGFNRPISRAKVDSFKAAVRGGATLPDIWVAVDAGTIEMVDGEHRQIAILELRAEGMEIPTMGAKQFRGDYADRIAHMLGSAQGEPITPLVFGEKCMELMRLQWPVKKIAERLGCSTTNVENCLRLAEAGADVKAHITNGDVTSTTAAKIVKEHGSKAGAVIKEALAGAEAAGKKPKVTPKMLAPKEKQKPKEVQKLLALLERCRPYVLKVADDPEGKTVAVSSAMTLLDDMQAAVA